MPISVFSIRESYKAKMAKAQEDRVNVEKSMFKAHTFYFLLSAGKASLFPLLTIYFRLLGLTATEVGLVFAAKAFVRLWCAPMWTACAKACRKKKFVLMFSTFVLLASSLCLSLAPPSDFQNSPLYCKGPITQLESAQENKIGSQKDNFTSDTVQPIGNITEHPVATGSSEIQPDSTEDEVNKQVDDGREHEKESTASTTTTTTTTTSTTEPQSTTVTTKSTTTPSTTARSTTTSESSRRHGHKHKEQKGDEISELADRLVKLNISPEDIDNLTDEQMETIVSSLLKKDAGAGSSKDIDNVTDEQLETLLSSLLKKDAGTGSSSKKYNYYNYNYDYRNYDDDKRWKPRQKRNIKGEIENNKEAEEEHLSPWENISGQVRNKVQEHKTLAFILILVVVGELFAAPVDKLADDCWFEYLDVLDVVERYGRHRVWQLMGYILLPTFVGTLVDKTNCILMHNIPHFMIHFFMFAAFAALSFMAAFGYPVSQNKRTPKQSRFGKGVRILCCDIHSTTLTITILFLGMMYACIQNFLLWKVQDIGGNEIVIGTSITVSAVSALFMYIISNGLIKRITHVGAIVLAMITLAGRLVFYSFLWTPWLVLAGEALHGFSYTLMWRAVEMYPDFRINPFIMDRSAFTLVNVIYHGLGIGIGSAVSGYLYDEFGFSLLFQGASVATAGWCAIFLLLQKCVKRKMKVRYAKLLQDDRGADDTSSEEEDWLEVAMKSSSK